MTNGERSTEDDLPVETISAEVSREKSVRKGHISALHLWCARRPNVLARVAAYLAITEEQAPRADFLAALGTVNPPASTLAEARSRVRDAAWQWCVREKLQGPDPSSVDSISPAPPKVLDPFAGGGSIPMEASRLGCHAYAGDLNPLAYRILRATIEYPAKLTLSDTSAAGTGAAGRWSGLANELRHWASEAERRASLKLADLFPSEPGAGAALDRYLWFTFVRCSSPSCGALYPAEPALRLARSPAAMSVSFSWTNSQPTPVIVGGEQPTPLRGIYICPVCGSERQADSVPPEELSGRLCLARRETGGAFVAVGAASEQALAPWSDQHEARLRAFLDRPECSGLRREISGAYGRLRNKGVDSFKRSFAPRQLLVAAEYVDAIREVVAEMRQSGLDQERIEALSTYLSFFLGYLVNRNSKLCSWMAERGDAGGSFNRLAAVLPGVFVERPPRGLMAAWLTAVMPAIEAASCVDPASRVFQGSASELPFEDDFFDAIVTDPPYYDRVPYADLADFFWVWEGMIGCEPTPGDQQAFPRAAEIAPTPPPDDSAEFYRQGMLRAFKEIRRVLKPGRKFCLIFSGTVTGRFQDYVDLCQQAGLDLVDVKRVPEQIADATNSTDSVTYLIYLRKPSTQPLREPLEAAEASSLLAAADLGKPVLYAALAELMAKRLSGPDLTDILPVGGKGDVVEQLMEVLADDDPREVLMKCFGMQGLREIANELCHDADEGLHTSPIERVLTYHGFSLPSTDRPVGAPQVRDKIRKMSARIRQRHDKDEMRGPFLEACTAVERLLRLSIWGWAQLIFGADRDAQLLLILKAENAEKGYDLSKLTMGNILALFRRLPDAMAASPSAETLERKFGRRHVYTNKKTKFVEVLDGLVGHRNKIEHDIDGYWTTVDAGRARSDMLRVLSDTERLLVVLVEAKAIPSVVEPIKEVRDKWNRRSYLLATDDGTDRQAHFSATLVLGNSYLYFGTETNPRPVDPLLLAIDEIGNIP